MNPFRQESIIKSANEVGIDFFLQKPINPTLLNDLLSGIFFDNINTHIANNISFLFSDKNNHPKATIKLYHTSVYELSELHQTSKGLINAKINENNNNVLDLYTSEVTTANEVFIIKNKNVVHTVRYSGLLSHIKYLHDNITK